MIFITTNAAPGNKSLIIQLSQKYFSFRYLPRERHQAVSLFFQAGNVGFRRSVFEKTGLYDPEFPSCEDVDMGIRFSAHGELFSNPNAEVSHTSNLTLKKIFNQWTQTARYQVKLLRKISGGGVEVFANAGTLDPESTDYRCLAAWQACWTVVIFLSSCLFLNLGLLLSLAAAFFPILLLPTIILIVPSSLAYFLPDFRRRDIPLSRRFLFCLLRFAINTILLWVSFLQGIRERMLYVSYPHGPV